MLKSTLAGGAGRAWRTPWTLVVGAAIALQLGVLAGIRLLAADPTGGDLCRDAVAMQHVLQGQNPYLPIVGCGALHNLPHPPAVLLLIGPFVLLPVAWGAAVWDLVALGALACGLVLVTRELRLAPQPWLLGALLLLLIFWPPLLGTLLEAQISPVLLLLFVLSWRWARHGQMGWAGAALGLAAALRLFPALAVLYFAMRREWRAVLAAVVAGVVAEALALPLVGASGFLTYLTSAAPGAETAWITNAHNVSLWGLAGMLWDGSGTATALVLAPDLARPSALALVVALLATLLVCTYARRHQAFAADEGTFLAYLPAMLLVSPLTWTHYFVILLLPIMVLAVRARLHAAMRSREGGGWWRARASAESLLLAVALALIWINDVVARLPLARPLPAIYALLVLALPTYALLLLGAALLLTSRRDAPSARGAPDEARHVALPAAG